jgi:hypothetical protein
VGGLEPCDAATRESPTAGGIELNAMGIVLLFEGLILSTASVELSKILG